MDLKSLFHILIFLRVMSGFAQNETLPENNPWLFGVRPHYGFIILHSQDLYAVKDSYPFGIELTAAKHLNSQNTWNECNCYPKIGASVVYFDYDSKRILGQGITTYGFVEPVLFARKKFHIGIRGGLGFSYLNRPHHATHNPENQSYSTYFSFFLPLHVLLHYRVNPHVNLQVGANYNHHSNGGIKVPNKGINFPTASVGVEYAPKAMHFENRLKDKVHRKKQRFDISLYGTQKGYSTTDFTKYPLWGWMLSYSKQVSKINALKIEFDYLTDLHLHEQMKQNVISGSDPRRIAVLGGHEFLLGRFIFSQALGVYVHDPSKRNDPVFQRWALSTFLSERLQAECYLKAHRHVADFVAIRVAYSLWKKSEL
jgi:hypothetical protein